MEKLNLQSSHWCARHIHQSGAHLAATISTLIPQGIRLLGGYFVVDLVISQIEILVQGQHPSESLSHFVMVVGCSARRILEQTPISWPWLYHADTFVCKAF